MDNNVINIQNDCKGVPSTTLFNITDTHFAILLNVI